ncbi:MAG: corrinoid protein [Candidatus Aminicenantes bacterium]|nr:corrinoid protein [Candidatus Aminicenantes bacterium]
MADLSKLYDAVVAGRIEAAGTLTRRALSGGSAPGTILNESLVPAMAEVGARFGRNEYYIPDMLISAEAMKTAMGILQPALVTAGVEPVGSVAIGTIKGDLHDIGKNLVAAMLEGNGFQVFNLGMNVAPEQFAAAVKEHEVDLIAISALLTTTMINMKEVIDILDREGLREQVKVIIGGAPVTPDYAEKIGADGFSDNANGAVNLTKQLISGSGERL